MIEKKTTEKAKGYQVYKIASELNLSKEHIIDFLKKKGIEVKNHMSKVDEDAYQLILNHFKKDKDLAEKHQKKITEFKKKQQEIEEKEGKKAKKTEPVAEIPKPDSLKFTVTDKEKVETGIVTKPKEKIEAPTVITEPVSEKEIVELPTPIETKVEIPPEPTIIVPIEPELKEEEIKDKIVEKVGKQEILETAPLAIEDKVVPPQVEEVKEEPKEVKKPKVEKEEFAPTSLKEEKEKKRKLTIKGKIELKKVEGEFVPAEEEKVIEEEEVKGEDIQEVIRGKAKRPKKKRLREELKKLKQEEDTKGVKVKRIKGKDVDEREVEEAIRRTYESMDLSASRSAIKKRKKKEKLEEEKIKQEEIEHQKKIIRVTEYISVNELSKLMNVSVAEVIAKCMGLGLMVSINQRLNFETITLVADEFGYSVELQEEYTSSILDDYPDPEDSLVTRPPVVTIMGHVDHGKTSLLDYIRDTHVVAGEAGGITQHIGAYKVILDNGRQITFLDTPGHEAFTAMRARGAQVTDIVVLVIAADDSVMPQTIEAINHAQAANVPIIIAINKIDKPTANIEKIRKQLAEKNVLVEEWGGKYQSVEISAKTGKNIDLLLEKILLEADVLDLKANPNRMARGVIIELKLDKGKGIVGTVLIQKGTLKIGDPFVAGVSSGKVRAMFDEREHKIEVALPATPVQILGFDEMPQAGDSFIVVESDKIAREISLQRIQIKREQDHRLVKHLTLDEISKQIQIGGVKELYVIVKGDVDGSVEALSDSLMKLSTDEVRVSVIHKGVGAIVESDVLLAAASNAIIIGFNVRPNINARKLAETEVVEIRLYNIIYNAINDVRSAVEGMLSPEISEMITGTVEVREIFKISKVGTIAGCYVQDGKIQRNNKIRIVREGIVIYEGNIETLKRFKDDVREVDAGYECGIKIEKFNDLKVGDIIESFKVVEKKRKLENVGKN